MENSWTMGKCDCAQISQISPGNPMFAYFLQTLADSDIIREWYNLDQYSILCQILKNLTFPTFWIFLKLGYVGNMRFFIYCPRNDHFYALYHDTPTHINIKILIQINFFQWNTLYTISFFEKNKKYPNFNKK